MFLPLTNHSFQHLKSVAILGLIAASLTIEQTESAESKESQVSNNGEQMHTLNGNLDLSQWRPPVIGILTQVLRDYKRFTDTRHLHLVSSYVKWVESAGAQVLPILINEDQTYYKRVFAMTDGLLFPGGDNLLNPEKKTPMLTAAKILYDLAVSSNDRGIHYPIWGTCLGLEMLSVLTANRNELERCSANDLALPLKFIDRGKLFKPTSYSNLLPEQDFSGLIMNALSRKNLTYNFHHKCITDAALKRANLTEFYRPLAYSKDVNNLSFIAILEAIKYPFYGVMFHPEKAAFEFVVKKGQKAIPHSPEAIAVTRYLADYFVASAREGVSQRKIAKKDLEMDLIYAYNPNYTAPLRDIYEQRYLFPYKDSDLSSEEFLDYLLGEFEEAPE